LHVPAGRKIVRRTMSFDDRLYLRSQATGHRSPPLAVQQ
jgi:hypothetical protein